MKDFFISYNGADHNWAEWVAWHLEEASENPDLVIPRIGLAGIYESQGRHEEARAVVQEILRVNPQLTAALAVGLPVPGQILDPKRRAQFREHLRSAGLP